MNTKNTVKTTPFEHNYHNSVKHYDAYAHEPYIRHEVDIYNTLSYGDKDWQAVYQTGMSYKYNDPSMPSKNLELSAAGGTHATLVKINEMYEKDFEDDDLVAETIKELNEAVIKTSDDLHSIYMGLMDNKGFAENEYSVIFDDDFKPAFLDNS